MALQLVHLIYIHGFQGNDTSFQSFPTDLHQHLLGHLSPHLKLQTSLYPTYKSAKPISSAVKNFLGWLATQPPANVIILGHSMGGLLAAEAATKQSDNVALPYRIVGLVAFDTPYLGMHPHIVISGIASLLPKCDGDGKKKSGAEKKKSNNELNNENHVKVLDGKVTDGWDTFKKTLEIPKSSINSPSHSPSPSRSPSPSPIPTSPSPLSPSILLNYTISLLASYGNESFARWLRKHADEPFTAGIRWVLQHFQFGVCMFDPAGLKERYARLVAWEGMWVNYWTETVPRDAKTQASADKDAIEKSSALKDYISWYHGYIPESTDSLISDTSSVKSLDQDASEIAITHGIEPTVDKELPSVEKQSKELVRPEKRHKFFKVKGRHFVIRPIGIGKSLGGTDKWEKVEIGGVEDEVAAHTGLFIREQNLDYEGLVHRVGKRVLEWCEKL